VEPDKKEFRKSIHNITNQTASDRDDKVYRASPQEIPAFAHQVALKIADNIRIDYGNNIPSKVEINRWIEGYIEKQFKNPKDPKEFNVFKRFHKLVYQEVMRYLERYKNRVMPR
jgi:hypothetical protein